MRTREQLVEDALQAFHDKKIAPEFGSFGNLTIADGKWALLPTDDGSRCGCAVSALVDGTECTFDPGDAVQDPIGFALLEITQRYALDGNGWAFVHGFDGRQRSSHPEDNATGRKLRELILDHFDVRDER